MHSVRQDFLGGTKRLDEEVDLAGVGSGPEVNIDFIGLDLVPACDGTDILLVLVDGTRIAHRAEIIEAVPKHALPTNHGAVDVGKLLTIDEKVDRRPTSADFNDCTGKLSDVQESLRVWRERFAVVS
ncbi:MAG: hypothetical protein IPO40_18695 [Fibrobacteres bacterium]|nr:hypothetical protein [Fibrobacterota bacterium]